jgi:hypothetical protein
MYCSRANFYKLLRTFGDKNYCQRNICVRFISRASAGVLKESEKEVRAAGKQVEKKPPREEAVCTR